MSKLVAPHGGKGLVSTLLHGNEREAELEKAEKLKKIEHLEGKTITLTGRVQEEKEPILVLAIKEFAVK